MYTVVVLNSGQKNGWRWWASSTIVAMRIFPGLKVQILVVYERDTRR